MTGHDHDQHRRWMLRLALAGYLDHVDSFNEVNDEIEAQALQRTRPTQRPPRRMTAGDEETQMTN
jgi:hypothetical protein